MSGRVNLAADGNQWMTQEVRAALMAIRGRHAGKKRATVIKLAFARADPTRKVTSVFGQEDTCAENIWYQKWQYDSTIAAALETCEARVLAWRDGETARLLAHYDDQRERLLAERSVVVIQNLGDISADKKVGAKERIDASMKVLAMADPDLAGRVQASKAPLEIEIANLDALIEAELKRANDEGISCADNSEGEFPAQEIERPAVA